MKVVAEHLALLHQEQIVEQKNIMTMTVERKLLQIMEQAMVVARQQ